MFRRRMRSVSLFVFVTLTACGTHEASEESADELRQEPQYFDDHYRAMTGPIALDADAAELAALAKAQGGQLVQDPRRPAAEPDVVLGLTGADLGLEEFIGPTGPGYERSIAFGILCRVVKFEGADTGYCIVSTLRRASDFGERVNYEADTLTMGGKVALAVATALPSTGNGKRGSGPISCTTREGKADCEVKMLARVRPETFSGTRDYLAKVPAAYF